MSTFAPFVLEAGSITAYSVIQRQPNLQMLHFILHVNDHLVGLRQVLVRPPALEPEKPHSGEVTPELVLLRLEVADLLAQLADLQSLQRRHLVDSC